MMKICMQMCKFSLISSNILLAIVGFGMICLGTYFQFIAAAIGLKITPFTTGVIALVITGILIMLVAVLGNHGACTHNTSVLNVLSGLLSLLIIINIAVGVMAFVRSGQMADDLATFYIKIYTQNPYTRRNNETKVLELFHKALDCCGTGEQTEELVHDTCPEDNYQKTFPSCPSVIQDMFNTNAPLVLGGFLGMAGIMMVALVCSVILSRQLSQSPTPPPEYAAFWEDIHYKWIRDLLSLCRKNLS